MSPIEKIKRSLGFAPKRMKHKAVKINRNVRSNNIMENENMFVDEEVKVEPVAQEEAPKTEAKILSENSFLLSQIDEFREKAKQLQELMFAKEKKAKELQNIVDEKDAKARALEGELIEKQKIASGITSAIEAKIDTLVEKVNEKISEIEAKFDNRAQEDAKLEEAVASLNESMNKMKAELEEKIHSEDVLCYRNMQTLIEDTDKKIESLSYKVNEVSKVKTSVNRLTILVLINIIGVAVILLTQYGII